MLRSKNDFKGYVMHATGASLNEVEILGQLFGNEKDAQ